MLCVVLLFSCGNKTEEKKFFDIPTFFRSEIANIKTGNFMVTKAYSYNNQGAKMDVRASQINWEKEFAIFLECDINKPAYFANMEILDAGYDSVERSTIYRSKSKKLNIQSVKVVSFNGVTTDISIRINKANLISNTTIDAYYTSGVRYSIIGTQTIKQLGEKNEFWVEGRFYH